MIKIPKETEAYKYIVSSKIDELKTLTVIAINEEEAVEKWLKHFNLEEDAKADAKVQPLSYGLRRNKMKKEKLLNKSKTKKPESKENK